MPLCDAPRTGVEFPSPDAWINDVAPAAIDHHRARSARGRYPRWRSRRWKLGLSVGLGNAKMMSLMLDRLGCRYDLVDNGAAVLATARERTYDLILMDLQMPDMNGLAATRTLRDGPDENRTTCIVAVTANALPEDHERCLAAGIMDGFLPKPITLQTLARVLANDPPLAGGAVGPLAGC